MTRAPLPLAAEELAGLKSAAQRSMHIQQFDGAHITRLLATIEARDRTIGEMQKKHDPRTGKCPKCGFSIVTKERVPFVLEESYPENLQADAPYPRRKPCAHGYTNLLECPICRDKIKYVYPENLRADTAHHGTSAKINIEDTGTGVGSYPENLQADSAPDAGRAQQDCTVTASLPPVGPSSIDLVPASQKSCRRCGCKIADGDMCLLCESDEQMQAEIDRDK